MRYEWERGDKVSYTWNPRGIISASASVKPQGIFGKQSSEVLANTRTPRPFLTTFAQKSHSKCVTGTVPAGLRYQPDLYSISVQLLC